MKKQFLPYMEPEAPAAQERPQDVKPPDLERSILDIMKEESGGEAPPEDGPDLSSAKELFEDAQVNPDELFRSEAEEEDQGEEPEKNKLGEDDYQFSGEMYSMLVSLGVPRICSIISGADVSRYEISNRDQNRLSDLAKRYFEHTRVKPNPTALFLAGNAAILGGNFWTAIEDRQHLKQKAATRKPASRRRPANIPLDTTSDIFPPSEPPPPPEIFKTPAPPPGYMGDGPSPDEKERLYFQVDSKRYYIYDNEHNYLRQSDRVHRMTNFVKNLWASMPPEETKKAKNKEVRRLIKKMEENDQ